jgi:hypothetical protein
MKKINIWLFMLVLLAVAGCKDPYEMELRSTDKSLLVVEGFLNKGAVTTIRLSRTISLANSNQVKPELNSMLTVEGKDNTSAPLASRGAGFYDGNLTQLEAGKEYRLRIRTADGKEYLSDYVTVKNTPPIDSVSWRQEDDGVRIFASAHDNTNNTLYYRWDYTETWEIHSGYSAIFKLVPPTTIVPRNLPAEDVSVCWKTTNSSTILVASTAQLNADVMKESPLFHIPRRDERLGHRYSVLVRQYALSKEAYEYLQIMKKNTESLGSIFDPQPAEVTGNIRSVSNPEEQVVGYITASTVQEKRLFITSNQLTGPGFLMLCESILVKNHPDSIRNQLSSSFQPYDAKYNDFNPNIIDGWFASSAYCVDCTSRGGTTVKPSFW